MALGTAITDIAPIFNKGLIIGCGLIGGSLGDGLVHGRVLGEVLGYDANTSHANIALRKKFIDEVAPNLEEAAERADVIILAVPVGRTDELVRRLGQCAAANAVIVDTGSVKQLFARQCEENLPPTLERRAVPCHPIAGHVSAGPQSADRALMAGRPMIMTPGPSTDADAVKRVAQMWRRIGFDVIEMAAQEHDALYADLSHMPHIMAFALMRYIRSRGLKSSTLKILAGNAFKDMTYHAGHNADMWRDIFRGNRREISRSLAGFRQSLDELELAINSEDEEHLQYLLTQLQEARLNAW